MNILIKIAYDGTLYHGFQKQYSKKTIQGEIEKALYLVFKQKIFVIGAGRTDAGVHALGQYATFQIDSLKIPVSKLPLLINHKLSKDIVILDAKIVDNDFHPRFCSKIKIYTYKILNTKLSNPLYTKYMYFFPYFLCLESMQQAAKFFLNTHDFASFCSTGSSIKSTVRTIQNIQVTKSDDIISITITGRSFLYNMVRIISGTLLYVGCDKINAQDIQNIILSKNRKKAGPTLPASGLILVDIFY